MSERDRDVVIATLLYDAADLRQKYGRNSRLGTAFENVAHALERRIDQDGKNGR